MLCQSFDLLTEKIMLCRKDIRIVILNGAQRSEESLVYKRARFFAALRMTFTKVSTEQDDYLNFIV